jgi:malate synthase
VARARVFLDEAFPDRGAPATPTSAATTSRRARLLADDKPLDEPGEIRGLSRPSAAPDAVLLRNNGLHVELVFDRTHPIGAAIRRASGRCADGSAVSAIMDCEDSVACVDAEDKVLAYGNWLGLMKGDLAESFEKGGETVTRAGPRPAYTAPDGAEFTVKGRALMLVRNVGHLMTNPAILTGGRLARSSRG